MAGRYGAVFALPSVTVRAVAGAGDVTAALVGIGEAITSSWAWPTLGASAVVVVRATPTPLLGVLTDGATPAVTARLGALEQQLEQVSTRAPRYVGYHDAEAATGRLAQQLRARLGRGQLDLCRFRAIPRGGHVVLGMLAYALDLRTDQLSPAPAPEAPLVLVDDCALSGARLRSVLDHLPQEQPVVVAHLCSTPELRAAVEATEPAVVACVAADDLVDVAPALYGVDHPAWQARWARRNPRDYWTGEPERVVFAWNEPDVNVWNPATGRSEPGWHLTPPARCTKNAVRARPSRVRTLRPVAGAVELADDVLWADVGSGVVAASASTGRAIRLTGLPADLWRATVTTGELPDGADGGHSFVAAMTAAGFLRTGAVAAPGVGASVTAELSAR